jgi:hypothetical protein
MIITRKAIIGFILLWIIVFATTQYTVSQMQKIPAIEKNTSAFGIPQPLSPGPQSYMVKSVKYQPPILSLGNNAPIIATIAIELFTLGCYLVLKKYESNINEAAVNLVEHYK